MSLHSHSHTARPKNPRPYSMALLHPQALKLTQHSHWTLDINMAQPLSQPKPKTLTSNIAQDYCHDVTQYCQLQLSHAICQSHLSHTVTQSHLVTALPHTVTLRCLAEQSQVTNVTRCDRCDSGCAITGLGCDNGCAVLVHMASWPGEWLCLSESWVSQCQRCVTAGSHCSDTELSHKTRTIGNS
jgi:hypothetical protein